MCDRLPLAADLRERLEARKNTSRMRPQTKLASRRHEDERREELERIVAALRMVAKRLREAEDGKRLYTRGDVERIVGAHNGCETAPTLTVTHAA